jgi:outer membrane protein OmpA-like peptidoglycan-associated protein
MQVLKSAVLCSLMILSLGVSFAQKSTTVYDVFDSAVITKKGMPQQNEFWNNKYNFPSKPKSMWEVGVSGGLYALASDVPSIYSTFGFSAHVRKSIGHVFSIRAQYMNGTARGLHWKGAKNFGQNDPLAKYYSAPTVTGVNTIPTRTAEVVFYNYKNRTQDLTLQLLASLNNINFYKRQSKLNIYIGAGFGISAYETMVNARDEANSKTYSDLYTSTFNKYKPVSYKDRKEILKALKNGMDNTYEEAAENFGNRKAKLGNQTINFATTFIGGVSYRLSKRINIFLEDRYTIAKDDLMDGQQWQENPIGNAVLTTGTDAYNNLSVGVNFNLGSKAIEPLWWINPLDYVYSELNQPKHQKIPKPVLDDTDGDGIIDQLDREPNTPAGVGVDSHGVTRDSDGDGVPDSMDKQMVTPTECQPVDANGVGKCPEPECCKTLATNMANIAAQTPDCPSDYPSLTFKSKTMNIGADMKKMLGDVAAKLKANPKCGIALNGYPEASKASQAACEKRLDVVKMYLTQKEGISADRISTNCEVGGGDKDTVDIKSN